MPSEPSRTEVTTEIARILGLYNFHYVDEYDLQDGIEEALKAAGAEYTREAQIDVGRLDFLVHAVFEIAIEVKIDGAPSHVVRQFMRYMNSDAIDGLVVVTSKRSHRRFAGTHVTGKSIEIVWLGDGAC